jgi:nickel superoxide dismutase
LLIGGMRALQTGKAQATARFTGQMAPQIKKFPEIHDLAHKIMLAGSACKQDVHRADGLKLVDLVNRFAEIYWATKDIKTVRKPCPYPPNIEVVYPVL